MSTYECTRCGSEYEAGHGGDPFTSVSVSYHDEDREDFAVSFCQECGDELLADLVEATDD
ncbi:hypothetical protein [Halobacterium salinarum]|uniref:hypothetical protein n=1 Tax=Halobacterium salinarum TaxID=2242 RepID=UPI0025559DFD|nr:hypothetical protein [Halobacterium salinarum]MDL0133547.1 hypothetical protein [Halobacterium salinarum]